MESAKAGEVIEYPGMTLVGEPGTAEPKVCDPFALESVSAAIQPSSGIRENASDQDVGQLIQKVSASSIAELERMIRELQDARAYLVSEGERIEREAQRYVELSKTTLDSVEVISGAVSEWRKAGHPV
jgi:hypothetical protein